MKHNGTDIIKSDQVHANSGQPLYALEGGIDKPAAKRPFLTSVEAARDYIDEMAAIAAYSQAQGNDALIIRAGRALWGDSWQAPMARALEVHKDTVQDWRQGRQQPRRGVYADLLRLAVERQAELDSLVDELKRIG